MALMHTPPLNRDCHTGGGLREERKSSLQGKRYSLASILTSVCNRGGDNFVITVADRRGTSLAHARSGGVGWAQARLWLLTLNIPPQAERRTTRWQEHFGYSGQMTPRWRS